MVRALSYPSNTVRKRLRRYYPAGETSSSPKPKAAQARIDANPKPTLWPRSSPLLCCRGWAYQGRLGRYHWRQMTVLALSGSVASAFCQQMRQPREFGAFSCISGVLDAVSCCFSVCLEWRDADQYLLVFGVLVCAFGGEPCRSQVCWVRGGKAWLWRLSAWVWWMDFYAGR